MQNDRPNNQTTPLRTKRAHGKTQALAQGEPISGLYAGGNDAGGLYGDSYDVKHSPGSQAAWAINAGRLAMKHAASWIGK